MTWSEADSTIKRRFEFDDFAQALAFVSRVGQLAESANHHPDITFGWGYAEVSLTSHDAGEVTGRDRELATKIDELVDQPAD